MNIFIIITQYRSTRPILNYTRHNTLGAIYRKTIIHVPRTLPLSCFLVQPPPHCMKPEGEAGGKGKMEVVRVPGNPVVSVRDVGIRVVPRPVHELHRGDVVGCVNKHNQ